MNGRRPTGTLTRFSAGADVVDGPNGRRLELMAPERFKAMVRRMPKGPKIVIVKPFVQASGSWRRFYWGTVVDIISEHTGYTKDEAHDALKLKFLGLEPPSESIPVLPQEAKVRSTSSLDDAGWRKYIEDIRIFAAQELNCSIPEKGEL